MNAPVCIVCGTEHWSRVPCSVQRVDRREPIELASNAQVTHATPVTHEVTHIESGVTHAPEKSRRSNAEKQRRWREAHADDVRLKNRERMRRKRATAWVVSQFA